MEIISCIKSQNSWFEKLKKFGHTVKGIGINEPKPSNINN